MWVQDRAENREPLMLNEFINFMTRLGYSKTEINKELTKNRKKQLVERHKILKKKFMRALNY